MDLNTLKHATMCNQEADIHAQNFLLWLKNFLNQQLDTESQQVL